MKPFVRSLVDFTLLQVGWFACVLAGAAGNVWVGPVTVVAFVAVHLRWVVPVELRRVELRNVLVLGSVGCVIDAAQARFGVLCFAESAWNVAGLPLWLVSLWFLFPIMFNTTFGWLHGRPVLAGALALVGAPLSYRAGVELGAAEIGRDEWLALGSLGVVWAVYLPAGLWFAVRGSGNAPAVSSR